MPSEPARKFAIRSPACCEVPLGIQYCRTTPAELAVAIILLRHAHRSPFSCCTSPDSIRTRTFDPVPSSDQCGNPLLYSSNNLTSRNLRIKIFPTPVLGEGHLSMAPSTGPSPSAAEIAQWLSPTCTLHGCLRILGTWAAIYFSTIRVAARVKQKCAGVTKTLSPTSIFDRSWLAIGNEYWYRITQDGVEWFISLRNMG